MTLGNPGPASVNEHTRLRAELDDARQELKDTILRATRVSRRVQDLEWALRRAEMRQPVAS